jgi:acetyl esterase/lipase
MRTFSPLLALFAVLLACCGQASAGEAQHIAYGSDPLQTLDFWRGEGGAAPLVIYVHGGGWRRGDKEAANGEKSVHFTGEGYAFAAINYRLLPTPVEQQAADIARAIATLIRRAGELGIDPDKVVLMGHSAGAQLSALVATDPDYLQAQALAPSRLSGVILLDGAAYDVPREIAESGPSSSKPYLDVFGSEPVRQRALSPTSHAEAPNAQRFYLLYLVDRAGSEPQTRELAEGLRRAGTVVHIEGISSESHSRLNRSLGALDDPATSIVDGILYDLFRRAG